MDAHLQAGIAIFNAGYHHAAHDAWEDHWLELEADTPDERFLHGLIQFTAAIHHGYAGNWAGLQGLADSGGEYLSGLSASYRGVNVETVRRYLANLAVDPEFIERTQPPTLRYEDEALFLGDLDFTATAVAASVFADELAEFDEAVIADAIKFARRSVEADEGGTFVSLVFDFVREPGRRPLVYDRLNRHVRRRRQREADVDGLFDP